MGYIKKTVSFFLLLLVMSFGLSIFNQSQAMVKWLSKDEQGLFVDRFTGYVVDTEPGPGFKLYSPLNKLVVVDVSNQTFSHTISVHRSDGVIISIPIEVEYHIFDATEYVNEYQDKESVDTHVDIQTMLRSHMRKTITKEFRALTFHTLLSYNNEPYLLELEGKLQQNLEDILPGIDIDAVTIINVELPEDIIALLRERKISQIRTDNAEEERHYEMAEKRRREIELAKIELEKVKLKADTLRIQAESEMAANSILEGSLTDAILKYKSIEASLALAQSDNAKVLIFGDSDNGGLPLILGGD